MKLSLSRFSVLLIFIVTTNLGLSQSSTDLFLMPITIEDSTISIGEAVNITNRDGYDNQPLFTPAGDAIYYTSIQNDQADIYKYTLSDQSISQVTDTPESEYSATVMPDGETFSVIRVSMEGKQHLWSYNLDGSNPEILLPDVEPVGYHVWVNDSLLFAFILGEPMTGEFISYPSQERQKRILNVGRGMRAISFPSETVIAVANQVNGEKSIVAFRPNKTAFGVITNTPAGGEDFDLVPNKEAILMGNGNQLMIFMEHAGWKTIHTFDKDITKISRLDISPDGKWLVLVSDR